MSITSKDGIIFNYLFILFLFYFIFYEKNVMLSNKIFDLTSQGWISSTCNYIVKYYHDDDNMNKITQTVLFVYTPQSYSKLMCVAHSTQEIPFKIHLPGGPCVSTRHCEVLMGVGGMFRLVRTLAVQLLPPGSRILCLSCSKASDDCNVG